MPTLIYIEYVVVKDKAVYILSGCLLLKGLNETDIQKGEKTASKNLCLYLFLSLSFVLMEYGRERERERD